MTDGPRPVRRDTVAERRLRVAAWGQILWRDAAVASVPQLVERVAVHDGTIEAALAVADRRKSALHPAILPVQQSEVVAVLGVERAVACHLASPRGPSLVELVERCGRLSEATAAVLFHDLLAALGLWHGAGLVAGTVSPDHLVLCPAGQDGEAALRLVHAGLPSLVVAARGQPLAVGDPGLDVLFPVLEVVAPEVLTGQAVTPASDTYSTCATLAYCALGRHVHAAPQPATVRALAQAGLAQPDLDTLVDTWPTLGPLIARGLQPQPWARAGSLAELQQATASLVARQPTMQAGSLTLLAPWSRGSILMPLAAFVQATPWADRWAPRAEGQTPAMNVRAGGQMSAPALDKSTMSPAHRAQLQAALERLGSEQVRNRQREQRLATPALRVAVGVAVLLVLLVLWALSMRRTRDFAPADVSPEASGPGLRRAVPPRPQPRDLTPEGGLGR